MQSAGSGRAKLFQREVWLETWFSTKTKRSQQAAVATGIQPLKKIQPLASEFSHAQVVKWIGWLRNYNVKALYVVLLTMVATAMVLCGMSPRRRLRHGLPGPERGPQGSSSSSLPVPGGGDRGGRREEDGPSRRSRTTSRDRGREPEEDAVAGSNTTSKVSFVQKQTNQTLKHLLAAAPSLDDGYQFTVKDALKSLDGPNEQEARRLLNDMLNRVEQSLPTENGDLSRLLFQRYQEVLQGVGYPISSVKTATLEVSMQWRGPSTVRRASDLPEVEIQIELIVVNNDYETYERLSMELSRVERLENRDVRPGEELH